MTRANMKLSVSDDGHSGVKRKNEKDCDANPVKFINPTKRKKVKEAKENPHTHHPTKTDSVEKEKNVRFGHEGEILFESEAGEKVGAEKKKIRKPRWSEERKIEERKRKAVETKQETPTIQAGEPRTKTKKRKKKTTLPTATVDSTSSLSTSSIQYLQHWRYDRSSWKFSKLKQTWLLKHTFDLKKIPASVFPILVEYISSSQGGARVKTYEAAANIIHKLEEKSSVEESDHDEEKKIMQCLEEEESEKEEIHQRARSIMQQLSDCV